MNKNIFLLALCLIVALQFSAQENDLRKKYINLSFSSIEMKQQDMPSLKSNYGAAFTVGRTFFLHKKPIAKMIRFGIDATWIDINYTNYKIEYRYTDQDKQESMFQSFHQAEIGMQVGPSITITPLPKLNISGYFRYAPSFSALYYEDNLQGGYASYFVGGGSVNYGVIGLGAEARFGECNYSNLLSGEGNAESQNQKENTTSMTSNFSGMRVYLTFRF